MGQRCHECQKPGCAPRREFSRRSHDEPLARPTGHGPRHRRRDGRVHRDRLARAQRPEPRRAAHPRPGPAGHGAARRTRPGPALGTRSGNQRWRRLPALPLPVDRLLRPDRLIDRRNPGPARTSTDPQRRRSGAAAPPYCRRFASRPDISGAIIVLPPEPSDQLVRAARTRLPIRRGRPARPMPRDIAAVSAAHFAGARSLASHLIELGHRRIGVIAGPDNWLASDARLAGHASALAEVGVLPDPSLVRAGRTDRAIRLPRRR